MALPRELQEQILCDLPTRALKSVRLACAPLNRVAEEYLFRCLLLYPDTESFGKLDNISTHPRFSYYVRGITYSGNILFGDDWMHDGELTFDTWQSSIGKGLQMHPTVVLQIRERLSHAEL